MVSYKARQGQIAYGFSIGILCLECNIPFIPGDVGNASSYAFPVQYLVVPGATTEALVYRRDPRLAESFIAAAQHLERQGVKAITGDCGYMAAYQPNVAAAVKVPVFLSSLMQVPLLTIMLGTGKKLGIIVGNSDTVDDRLLAMAGIVDSSSLVFGGLQNKPEFASAILEECGALDRPRLEAEVVDTAESLCRANPTIGALLLECSCIPPYSAAVQRATGLPVFDYIGFINYVHSAVVRTDYVGFL